MPLLPAADIVDGGNPTGCRYCQIRTSLFVDPA
jgi:hypothetical protein